jgi:hypothetical protein
MKLKWYYKIMGGHTHVRVFCNGAKCGDLVFRNEEFDNLQPGAGRQTFGPYAHVEFIEEK